MSKLWTPDSPTRLQWGPHYFHLPVWTSAGERTERLYPLTIAEGWRRVEIPVANQWGWRDRTGLTVLLSASVEGDGRDWLHVSLSRRTELPSWDDLVRVKRDFVGPERTALQVLPPETEWVNDHPSCLHLFACLNAAVVPDFRSADATGRMRI